MYSINRGVKNTPKRVFEVNYAGADLYAAARVFGTGNPMTTGATGGVRHIVARRNISKFTVAGTAKSPLSILHGAQSPY